MKESTVEDLLLELVEAAGGLCEKFTTPGRRGPPDRLVTLCGSIDLVELKKPKVGRLSARQIADHKRRARAGCRVYLLYTLEAVREYVEHRADAHVPYWLLSPHSE